MDDKPLIQTGDWWIPIDNEEQPHKCSGKVTCSPNEDPVLELFLNASDREKIDRFAYDEQPVIFGEDLYGTKFTLFTSHILGFTNNSVTLRAEFFLIGLHIKSRYEKHFLKATAHFANLKYWLLYRRVFCSETDDVCTLTLTNNPPKNTLSVEVEEGISWNLRSLLQTYLSGYEWRIVQDTTFGLQSAQPLSLDQVSKHISEFAQFLSVAFLKKQTPDYLYLWIDDNPKTEIKLLFKQTQNTPPTFLCRLIRAEELMDKMPTILKTWHSNYSQLSTICTYLVNSLEYKSSFDAPDFLIVAQVLDGYFKRFLNHQNGKDIRQYQQQIEGLLQHFEGVEVVKQIHFSPQVMTDTRNKYSHLVPDGDGLEYAITDMNEMRQLTAQAKVVLVCCVLEGMGLNIEEINNCCKGANIINWM